MKKFYNLGTWVLEGQKKNGAYCICVKLSLQHACMAIQRAYRSNFELKHSSTSNLYVCK